MANPIWKDYYVDLGADEQVEFKILKNGETIYQGVSAKRPGVERNEIRINDICADYLSPAKFSLSDSFVAIDYPQFQIRKRLGTAWKILEDVTFYNDWSYDNLFKVEDTLSCPIVSEVSNDGILINTIYYGAVNSVIISYSDKEDEIIPINHLGSSGNVLVNLRGRENMTEVKVGNLVYRVVSSCSKYTLYYVNAYGGWDFLPIKGNHVEEDNLTRHTMRVEYDNRIIQNRGTHNYLNEITKNITLHTSWLTDEESLKMHHLLNSNEVYLCDKSIEQVIPVLLTNSSTKYKTYKNNGGRLVDYTIEVSYANDRIRR